VHRPQDQLPCVVEEVNLEGPKVTHEQARQEGQSALALLGREGERRAVRLDRVLVARFDAEQLGQLALLHDHELAAVGDDGQHFGHAARTMARPLGGRPHKSAGIVATLTLPRAAATPCPPALRPLFVSYAK
jgi:hypothetical protein